MTRSVRDSAALSDANRWERIIGETISPEQVEPLTWALIEKGRRTDAGTYLLAGEDLPRISRSVPLLWNDDSLPIGVQFIERFGDEATLVRLAAQLEATRPWAHRRPLVSS